VADPPAAASSETDRDVTGVAAATDVANWGFRNLPSIVTGAFEKTFAYPVAIAPLLCVLIVVQLEVLQTGSLVVRVMPCRETDQPSSEDATLSLRSLQLVSAGTYAFR